MNKIDLYIDKINLHRKNTKYLYKLSKEILLQTGGFLKEIINRNAVEHNFDELMGYIKTKIVKHNISRNKYLVILMGPPGSGKSRARDVVCKFIEQKIESLGNLRQPIQDFKKSFIDIEVDDVVYNVNLEKRNTIEPSGIEKFNQLKTKINMNIPLYYTESNNLYFGLRKHIESVPEIMLYIAAYLGTNIFFETVGDKTNYIEYLINTFCVYYGYIPIIIYTHIKNIEEHKRRLIIRTMREGRAIEPNFLEQTRNNCNASFSTLMNKFQNKNFNNNIIYLINFENSQIITPSIPNTNITYSIFHKNKTNELNSKLNL